MLEMLDPVICPISNPLNAVMTVVSISKPPGNNYPRGRTPKYVKRA